MQHIIMRKKMSARAIVNIGAQYKTGPFTFAIDVHNLLNTRYYRSGMNTNLIPQQGRWLLASAGYKETLMTVVCVWRRTFPLRATPT